jgi:polyisoprenoid-binding protein YceI
MTRVWPVFPRVAVARAALVAAAAFVWLSAATAAIVKAEPSDLWRLDPDHTDSRFSWDHLGVSRQSGTITDVSGRLRFAPTRPLEATIEVTARVESLATGVAALDRMLKSPDYFDAKRFGLITFKSTDVRQTGERTADVDGVLTIRDQAHPVTLATVWNYTGEHPLAPYNPIYRGQWVSGFTATTKVLRSRWGLSLAAPLVSDEIELVLNAEFIRVD